MCTWAYAWISAKQGDYMPLLFIVAIVADATMVVGVADAIFRK